MAEGIIGRVAKKLEQVLGVPRPWELGLAPSVGYQLATGEGSLGERVRKGGAQFLGRYATNMVDPAMELNLPRLNQINPRAIIKDQAPWLTTAGSDTIGNEVFAREMFDLPPRFPVEQAERAGFVKTGPKQYTLEGRRTPEGIGEGLHYNSLLGRYNVTKNPETQNLEYKDVWDISSPVGSSPVINLGGVGAGDYQQEGSLLSHMIREAVNPYLRPVTVSGSISNPEPEFKGFPSSHPFVSNKDGSKSNVKLATVGLGDKTFVIPTMVGGKDLSIQQAVKTAKDYGLSSYPSFTNPQDAESWSKKHHGSIDEKGRLKSK